MGSDSEKGWFLADPFVILPKGEIVKLVIDARYLPSVTDWLGYLWLREPY